MRRVLPLLGLILLTTSFVWFIRVRPPLLQQSQAPRSPTRNVSHPFVVVLDPGHGGQDSGATWGNLMEKDLTLDVALRAEQLLRAAGATTILTRDQDRYLSLADRAAVANGQDDSIFVSIHFNDDARLAASGVETYFADRRPRPLGKLFSWLPFFGSADAEPLSARSESLARFLQASLVARTGALDRGTKSEQFYVIANVEHPAALIEGGFITNKVEVAKLSTTEYRQQVALAISEGIERFEQVLRGEKSTMAVATTDAE